jgi:uncharacterized protein (TIGR01777 family)
MRVAVAGASGLIGSALITALDAFGHEPVRLVRPGSPVGSGISWDPDSDTVDAAALVGVDAVVNLAGRSIGSHRWDSAEKGLILSSRVRSTRLLSGALASLDGGPRVLLNASAVGYYGDRGSEVLTEQSGPGRDFFSRVCLDWEAATAAASGAGIRVISLRTSVVLSPRGGTLERLLAPLGPRWLSPYRWGLGGWIRPGSQMISWISIEDEVRAIIHLLGSPLSGPVNLAAPVPVTNKDFMKAVGRALGRPILLPIPRLVPRVLLGAELAGSLLFGSQWVIPERLLGDGFRFHHSTVESAMGAALSRPGAAAG